MNGNIFRQLDEVAMGLPTGPPFLKVFVTSLKIIQTKSPANHMPMHISYVDYKVRGKDGNVNINLAINTFATG